MERAKFIHFAFSILVLGLAACSSENGLEPDNQQGNTIQIGATGFSMNLWSADLSRADDEGYELPSVEMPQTIGVYGFSELTAKTIFDNQKMFYRNGEEILSCGFDYSDWPADNDWPYDPRQYWTYNMASDNFLFYAYAPHIADGGRPSISNATLSYSGFSILRIEYIRPIDVKEQLLAASATWKDVWSRQPHFTLEHMTARLRLRFSVSQAYDELRDIRLKEVYVNDLSGAAYWQYVINTSVTPLDITATAMGLYEPEPTPLQLRPEHVYGDDGLPLHYASGYLNFGSVYLAPQTMTTIVVTVVYDVYDEQGVLTRSNQKARNTVNLGSLPTLQRGVCYDARIMVSPLYLYVLSDNDVMPDGLIDVE